jgi:DNA-binding CsgD family transcriptional regulator
MVYAPNFLPTPDQLNPVSMFEVILATLMDAVMIVHPNGTVLQANAKAKQLCDRLSQAATSPIAQPETHLPTAIQPLFAALLESRRLFPEHRILPEFEMHLDDRTPLRIRGQFIDIPRSDGDLPYVLITIENRQESLNSVAIGDAQRFGFTARETEIWHLRLLGQSYREIATQLFITENTVRKHVKNILAKRRGDLTEIA